MAQSLLEKFVSSAVRQVGKDTGKVISNSLYGDAHSTPVRHIRSEQPKPTPLKPKTVKEILEERRNGAYTPQEPIPPAPPPPTPLYSAHEERTTKSSEWKGFGCFLIVVFVVVFVVTVLCNLYL